MIIQMPSPGPLVGGGHLSAPGQLAIGEPRPRRWLSWSAGALAAMLIVLAAMALDDHLRPPRSLAGAVLTGPRGPACVRVVVAPDMSGTMTEYAAARRAAMAQLIPWRQPNFGTPMRSLSCLGRARQKSACHPPR